MSKEVNKYSDVTPEMLKPYSSEDLTFMSHSYNHLSILIIKDGMMERKIYDPEKELEKGKTYQCYEYERTSGAGITYTYILIYDFYGKYDPLNEEKIDDMATLSNPYPNTMRADDNWGAYQKGYMDGFKKAMSLNEQ